MLQINLLTKDVSYAGECRDGDDSSSVLDRSDENSFTECKEKCDSSEECVALAHQHPTDTSRYNCILYKGGPYTSGNGQIDTTCYIVKEGKLCYLTYKYLSTKTNHYELMLL